MVTKTYIPAYLCDTSDSRDNSDSSDSSESCDSSDSSDSIEKSMQPLHKKFKQPKKISLKKI